MEKKVYVVWDSGFYTEGIAAIFSTQEKADEFLEHSADCNYDAFIEEYDIDGKQVDYSFKHYDIYRRNGDELAVVRITHDTSTEDFVTYDSEKRIFTVKAKTRKEAIAIAEERERYIEGHPDEYPALGKVCIVRKRTGSYPFIEDLRKYVTYNFCTKEMVLPKNVEFRKILDEKL